MSTEKYLLRDWTSRCAEDVYHMRVGACVHARLPAFGFLSLGQGGESGHEAMKILGRMIREQDQ